jgi:hypothetical protein
MNQPPGNQVLPDGLPGDFIVLHNATISVIPGDAVLIQFRFISW